MQMCPECDRYYDESEYSRCPYCHSYDDRPTYTIVYDRKKKKALSLSESEYEEFKKENPEYK